MALARSRRSGPNGDVQLTPTPIASRGLAEPPRKNSLKPFDLLYPVGQAVGSPGRIVFVSEGVVSVAGRKQVATMSVRIGLVMLQSEPTSTKADGRSPTLRRPELVGNSSSS